MPQWSEHSFGIHWRKALVSIPRAVPDFSLRYTTPEGPQPVVIKLPSRGKHLIPVYLFIPDAARDRTPRSGTKKLPVLMDCHGGGFILGTCKEQTPFCAQMARELDCIVLSLDYRLGPYDQFPAAIEDAEDILGAILDPSKPGYREVREAVAVQTSSMIDLDTNRIGCSGFSSGGNLALNMALSVQKSPFISSPWPSLFPHAHAHPIPLLLFYPSLDCRQLPSERPYPPGLKQDTSFVATLRLEDELMPKYLPRDIAGHPRASPGLADIRDGGLHPQTRILLVLPEQDTLASQSEVWVQKVADEGRGKDLVVERVSGVLHGWTQFPDSFLDDNAKALKVDAFKKARIFLAQAWGIQSGQQTE